MHSLKIEDNQISIDGYKLKGVKEYDLKAVPKNTGYSEVTIKLQVKDINPIPQLPALAKGGIFESEQITTIEEAKKMINDFERQIGILKRQVQIAEACQKVAEAFEKLGKSLE